jgi:DNA replication and repair protein RecF
MVMGKSSGDDGDHRMGIEYGAKRRLRVDGETVRKASEFIGRLNVVAFVPEDIELIKGGASDRRRFLDVTLTQLTPGYLQVLQSYEKALKSRNALLRSQDPHPSALAAYDEVLIDCGSRLIFHRRNFFQSFMPFIDGASTDLLPETHKLTVKYQSLTGLADESSIEDMAGLLRNGLQQNADRDKKYGQTHCGPHRDDFGLYFNERLLVDFGSEGQCRLAAMSLKLAKARLMFDVKDEENVILLVDDVIGELDERGCKAFMTCVSRSDQAFIACTESEKLHGVEANRTFCIDGGTVTQTSEG